MGWILRRGASGHVIICQCGYMTDDPDVAKLLYAIEHLHSCSFTERETEGGAK